MTPSPIVSVRSCVVRHFLAVPCLYTNTVCMGGGTFLNILAVLPFKVAVCMFVCARMRAMRASECVCMCVRVCSREYPHLQSSDLDRETGWRGSSGCYNCGLSAHRFLPNGSSKPITPPRLQSTLPFQYQTTSQNNTPNIII